MPFSCPSSPVCAVPTGRWVPRPRPPPIPVTHAMALRPSSVPLCVPLPPPPESSLHAVPNPESDLARATSPTVSRLLATAVTDPSFESTAASTLVAELVDFAAACRLDYVVIFTIGLNVPKTKDRVHSRISAQRLQTLIAFWSHLQMTCLKLDLERLDVAYTRQSTLHDFIKY
ncbi:unnamed protein product [Closterium sp. NIES-54]